MVNNTMDPLEIVKEKGWLRITDKTQLQTLCDELISKSSEKVSKNIHPQNLLYFINNTICLHRQRQLKMETQNYLNGLLARQWVAQEAWPIQIR